MLRLRGKITLGSTPATKALVSYASSATKNYSVKHTNGETKDEPSGTAFQKPCDSKRRKDYPGAQRMSPEKMRVIAVIDEDDANVFISEEHCLVIDGKIGYIYLSD